MKNKRKKPHLSDEGFSLMELIITMLVSAIVTAAAAGFLVAGVQFYNRANAETIVQKESQVAELFITELIQESVDYKFTTTCPAGINGVLEVDLRQTDESGNEVVSLVIWKDEQLWYAPVPKSVTDEAAKINTVISAGKANAFLADCVTMFTVSPGQKPTEPSWDGLVNATMVFEEANKSYTETSTISWRNKKRN